MMQKILKGDTSGQVSLALADGFDYTDATVEVFYQGAVRQFKNCAAGQTIQFAFTAAETAPMALGVFPVTVRIGKPDGTLITVANAGVKIAVTDCIGEVRAGSVIAVDAHGGLYGVDDLPANYTIKDLRSKINEIITKLGGGVAALCLLACTAFGAGVNVHTAALEDIPNGAQVVTNVNLSGFVDASAVDAAITSKVTKAYVEGLGIEGGTGGGLNTNAVRALIAPATNATLTAANAYTRAQTDAATNAVTSVLKAELRSASLAATNYTATVAATKADKVTGSSLNNKLAALDANGNLKSSGYSYDTLPYRSSSWVPSWSQVTSKPSWIGSSKPTYTYDEVGASPAVDGGYLPRSAGYSYTLSDNLCFNDPSSSLGRGIRVWVGDNEFGQIVYYHRHWEFSDGNLTSDLYPDGTDVMTLGQADYHIVSNATVTAGQIANLDLAGLSCKTVTVQLATATTKSGDAMLWTAGNTNDCTMTFLSPLTPHGDDGYLKATANKKCLFLFSKVSATDLIVTKKEFD